jgi:hypothetical protein
MGGQYLSHTNKRVTVAFVQKKIQVNKAAVRLKSFAKKKP